MLLFTILRFTALGHLSLPESSRVYQHQQHKPLNLSLYFHFQWHPLSWGGSAAGAGHTQELSPIPGLSCCLGLLDGPRILPQLEQGEPPSLNEQQKDQIQAPELPQMLRRAPGPKTPRVCIFSPGGTSQAGTGRKSPGLVTQLRSSALSSAEHCTCPSKGSCCGNE